MNKQPIAEEVKKRMTAGSMPVGAGMKIIADLNRGTHDRLLQRLEAQPVGVLIEAMEGKV